jgi:hypothetical protein
MWEAGTLVPQINRACAIAHRGSVSGPSDERSLGDSCDSLIAVATNGPIASALYSICFQLVSETLTTLLLQITLLYGVI